jgi:hypothetical protein
MENEAVQSIVHHLMDETFLLKKIAIVHAIKAIPSDVSKAMYRIRRSPL